MKINLSLQTGSYLIYASILAMYLLNHDRFRVYKVFNKSIQESPSRKLKYVFERVLSWKKKTQINRAWNMEAKAVISYSVLTLADISIQPVDTL